MGEVHIRRDYKIPAAIQFKNPGAMWPNAIATKWGSTQWQYLSDGTGQGGGGHGNKIAIFDTWVDGISAQLDLWRSSKNYKNKTLRAALAIWSGGNSPGEYVAHVVRRIPSMSGDTVMNEAFWRSTDGLKFLKVQAEHEAGKPIPATTADYAEAQRRVFSGVPTLNTVKKATVSTGSVVPTTVVLHQAGVSLPWALVIGVGIAVAIFVFWKLRKQPEVFAPVVAPQAPEAPESPVQPVPDLPLPTQPTP